MPTEDDIRTQVTDFEAFRQEFVGGVRAALRVYGFDSTLKSLKKGRYPAPRMMTVYEGVVEETPSGLFDAALHTDRGRILLRNAQRSDRAAMDAQMVPSANQPEYDAGDIPRIEPDELLNRLTYLGEHAPASLVCEIELTRFDAAQRQKLLPALWQYILRNRDNNSRDKLAAVGAAIRKYIAIMPMCAMGQVAILLEPGHRSVLPIEIEIEVAKMIYRNFEIHPPLTPDPHPELSATLCDMARTYAAPRLLSRDKHSAAASLSIQAIVAMRSELAAEALGIASISPYRWFTEIVIDSLHRLHDKWRVSSPESANWLESLTENQRLTV